MVAESCFQPSLVQALGGGRALVCNDQGCQVYDSATGWWTPTGSIVLPLNTLSYLCRRDGAVVAAGTFYRTETVVGLSNVVADATDEVTVWHDLAAIAAREFPGLPVVGYESDDDLEAAHKAGFEVGDPLRVWVLSRN